MDNHTPSSVRAALADPKGSSTARLEVARTFVMEVAMSDVDFTDPEQFELLQEEYARRTDPEYMTPDLYTFG